MLTKRSLPARFTSIVTDTIRVIAACACNIALLFTTLPIKAIKACCAKHTCVSSLFPLKQLDSDNSDERKERGRERKKEIQTNEQSDNLTRGERERERERERDRDREQVRCRQ